MNAAHRASPTFSVNMAGRSMGPGGVAHRFGGGPAMPKPRSTRRTLGRLSPLLFPHAGTIALVAGFVLAGAAATLGTPWIIGHAIDALRRHGPDVRDRLGLLSWLLAAAYATGFASTWIQTWFMVEVAQRIVARLRGDLFVHLQKLPLRFFDTRSDGDIMSRFQNDLDSLSTTLSQNGVQLLGSVVSVGGALVLMFLLDPRLALAGLLPVPLGFFLSTRIARRCHRHFADLSRELGALNGLSEEVVGGIGVVRAFGREQVAMDEFLVVNSRLRDAGIRAQSLSGIIPPLMGLVNNLSFALATLAGGWLVLHGKATLGSITAFTLLARQFARPLGEISTQFNLIQASLAGAERIFEILDEPPEDAADPEDPAAKFTGHVEFQGATFSYLPDLPVLRDLDFEARPGTMVALVGPTGSGKTTIVNLLARFYDLDRGTVRIDGIDLREMGRHRLRRNLGIVLQDAHLFTGTIRENLLYGDPTASQERMREAARMANAEPFILRLAKGYDTPISEAGAALSQGERQLLTIARAILADPAILVLDEATSSVDTRTELHIQEAMRALRRGRTSFVVAHRLSTIRQADLILVLENGRIVQRGTHVQLLEREGLYAQMHSSQIPETTSPV
jgi:ATP-binding cassette, subfamily B, multidrug efflux pump